MQMIGQNKLKEDFLQLIDNGKFPGFVILVGPKGSGKKTLVKEAIIPNLTDGLWEECGTKMDDIRELIKDAYTIHSTAVYFIPDADTMSINARNALLKVVEELPNNSYFIMTLEDINNIVDRCIVDGNYDVLRTSSHKKDIRGLKALLDDAEKKGNISSVKLDRLRKEFGIVVAGNDILEEEIRITEEE